MKMKTLSVLAGISAPLIATAGAEAGFVGISVASKPNDFGLWVCNVYAEFNNATPGADAMQAVAGTPGTPLSISVIGGTFYNQPTFGLPPGGDKAPLTALIGVAASLEFDSFFTIGVKAVGATGQPADQLSFVPGSIPGGLAGASVGTANWSYALLGPQPQGNPFDPINSFPGNGQILIGQFSTADGTGIVGSFLLQFVSDGVVTAAAVSFEHIIPTPGALSLLGAAGLLGFRRRRR